MSVRLQSRLFFYIPWQCDASCLCGLDLQKSLPATSVYFDFTPIDGGVGLLECQCGHGGIPSFEYFDGMDVPDAILEAINTHIQMRHITS